MFCPNCGNNCGDANFCSNCGRNLKDVAVTELPDNKPTDKRAEMIFRYGQYMPNRLEAIRILRQDTGMGVVEASHTIDDLFGKESNLDKHLDKQDLPACPRCGCTSISANKRGYSIIRARLWGIAAGTIGAQKVVCTCLKCGYQWKAGKR